MYWRLFITKTSSMPPSRLLWNASLVPSGDHDDPASAAVAVRELCLMRAVSVHDPDIDRAVRLDAPVAADRTPDVRVESWCDWHFPLSVGSRHGPVGPESHPTMSASGTRACHTNGRIERCRM